MTTNADLEQRLSALSASAGALLIALRSTPHHHDGTCVLCRAKQGERHRDSCPAWPFIAARVEADTGEPCRRVLDEAEPQAGALL